MTPDAGLVSGHAGSPHWLTPSTHLYVQSLFVPPHTPSLNIPYVWHCPTYPVRISQICMFLLFLSSWWLQSLGWPFSNLYLQFLNQLLTRDFWSSALSLLFLVYQACVSMCPHSLLSPICIIAFCTDDILDQISFRKQTLSPSKYHYNLFSDLVLLVPASTDVLRT